MRLRIVLRLTMNRPNPFFPLMCVKPRKSNVSGLAFPSSFPVLFGKPTELDPARLVGMEFQPKLPQPFPKVFQETICFRLMLESYDGVIRIADDHHLALRIFPAPDVHPEIENVVQVDIREERRNHRTLRTPCLRFRPFAFLHHSGA